ncbi:MAG: hypothetical protein ACRDTF_07455 [Pseudonocardiaceae bacterium]
MPSHDLTSPPTRDLRRLALILAVTVVLALAAVPPYLTGRDHTRPTATGQATMPPAPAAPTTMTPPPYRCGTISTVDLNGVQLPDSWLTLVQAVHAAACRQDYETLKTLMSNSFNGYTPEETIAAWRMVDPQGVYLIILASTLERKGTVSQGGIVYCQPHGAVAQFSRGTIEHPGAWEYFDIFRIDGDTPC